jgi:hypothetical protein
MMTIVTGFRAYVLGFEFGRKRISRIGELVPRCVRGRTFSAARDFPSYASNAGLLPAAHTCFRFSRKVTSAATSTTSRPTTYQDIVKMLGTRVSESERVAALQMGKLITEARRGDKG